LCSLICLNNLPVFAETEEVYRFEKMWPVLQQPWYFDEIWDLVISQQDYIYVVDRRNNRVIKLTLDGHLINHFGTSNDNFRPIEIAVDSQENLYVSYTTANQVDSGEVDIYETTANRLEHLSHLILKFNAYGELISDKWREYAQCSENLGHIAVDDQDHLYMTCVLKEGQSFVHKLTSDGQWLEKWSINSEGNLAIYRDHIYILVKNGDIQKYTLDGEWVMNWNMNENEIDDLFSYEAKDIAIDNHGGVYVTDSFNYIQKFTSTGQFINKWRDEINMNGILQTLQQQSSPMEWEALKLISFAIKPELDYQASFRMPLVVGPQDNVYVAYTVLSPSIKKYTSEGKPITQWASGGNATPQILQMFAELLRGFIPLGDQLTNDGNEPFKFHLPIDIAVDNNGYLYITDSQASRVLKLNSNGQLLAHWGTLGQGQEQFISPMGIAIDTEENLYIVDQGNFRVQKWTTEGEFISQWGKQGFSDSNFVIPLDITIDKNNDVYVLDAGAKRIKKFTSDGHFINAFGDENLLEPWSITVDNNDNIYVVDAKSHNVKKFTTDGKFVQQWGSQGNLDGQFEKPISVATDEVGNIYVSDSENHRIQKFTSDGKFKMKWGKFGTYPSQFNRPGGLTVSAADHQVYVVDTMNNRIQVFNRTLIDPGKAIIVAGGGPYDGNDLWDDTQMVANFAYRALAYQGFTKNTIYYLSAAKDLDLDNNGVADDVDAEPTETNLEKAITEWASDVDNLTIFLTNHGGDKVFTLQGEVDILNVDKLNEWLNSWQSKTQGRIKVIYDACYSGSFVQSLKAENRIIITSAAADEKAYFDDKGSLSFSNYFWTHVFNGLDIEEAFTQASGAVNYMHHVETKQKQTPWLEANGDGCVNKNADFQQVKEVFIGNGTYIHKDAPEIEAVSPEQTLTDTNTAIIHAEIKNENIARVWAVVRSPIDIQQQIQSSKRGIIGQPILKLPSFELKHIEGTNRYEGSNKDSLEKLEFEIEGRYEVAIYARDRDNNTSIPKTTSVFVKNPLNRKAVIIVGESPTEAQSNAKDAYETLKYQGYRDDNIYYISDTAILGMGVQPVLTTLDNVKFALTTWAEENTQNIVIYMEGLGNEDELILNDNKSEILPFNNLKDWLDALQPNIPGSATVIYEGPTSGYLLPALGKAPEDKTRIVITSHGTNKIDESKGNAVTFSFSKFFWQKVYNGANTRNAFRYAASPRSITHKQQTPQLDANGNGIGNEPDDIRIALKHSIGIGVVSASKPSIDNRPETVSCLIPSQMEFHQGDRIQVKPLPFLSPTDYNHYFAVGSPDGHLFAIQGLNDVIPFETVETLPIWANTDEMAIDMPDANLPPGGYRLYSVTLPKGTPLKLPLDPKTFCSSCFWMAK
jgi:sugar lactone lactonase YvrE